MPWLVDAIGPTAATAVTWIIAVLVVVLLLLLVLRMLRSLLPGTYVRGGKSRHRLAVVDAAPVDARRRLILVRRDGVEHLLLIGGAGDVVVEAGIGAPAAAVAPDRPVARPRAAGPEPVDAGPGGTAGEQVARRAMAAVAAATVPPPPTPQRREQATVAAPAADPVPPDRTAADSRAPHQGEPVQRDEPVTAAIPEPAMPGETAAQPAATVQRATSAVHGQPEPPRPQPVPRPAPPDLSEKGSPAPDEDEWTDEALMRELQETLAPVRQPYTQPQQQTPPPQPAPPAKREMSLEEEMSQLLHDLTRDGNKP